MQAKCPHCQSVFSADHSGVQFCPSCGKQLNVPDVATVPTTPPFGETALSRPPLGGGAGGAGMGGGGSGGSGGGGMPPGPDGRQDTPWERMKELGFFPAFLETWKAIVMRPQSFLATVRPNGSWPMALAFAWICYSVGQIIAIPFQMMSSRAAMAQLDSAGDTMSKLPPQFQEAMRNVMAMQGKGAGMSLGGLILFPLFLIIMAGVVHLFCLMLSMNKNGFYATLRALSYAFAPAVFGFFGAMGPLACLGIFIGIWELILAVLALKSLQESSIEKAALAIVGPLVVVFCCCCGVGLAFGGMIAGLARGVH